MGRLFWKILLTFWLSLLVAGVLAGVSVWLHQRSIIESEQQQLFAPRSALAIRAAANTLEFGGKRALYKLLSHQNRLHPFSVYAVDDSDTELLGRPVPPETLLQARLEASTQRGSQVLSVNAKNGATYLLFVPTFDTAAKWRRAPPPRPAILIGIGLAVSFLSCFLLAWYFARPIRELRQAFGDAAAGRLDRRIGAAMGSRRDELADLGRDFDYMASHLQDLLKSQRRLLHDVSHELRSPLARLNVCIALARQQPESIDVNLDRIERESQRLDQLVGQVLTLARLEAGAAAPHDEPIDIADLLQNVCADAKFEAHAIQRDVALILPAGDVPSYSGNPELLHQAFENIARNAVHHTHEHSCVDIALYCEPDQLVIDVSDAGPGVVEHDLEAIFEPFHRSVGSASGGYGLGLAIAKRAIEWHGGRLSARNKEPHGLVMRVCLPYSSSRRSTSVGSPAHS